jgi:predicted MFS family arabinose efflux permease
MRAGSWPHIVFIYCCGLGAAASLGLMGPIAADIAAGFAVTPQDVGLAIAGQLLPLAVAGFPIGWLIGRLGSRFTLRVALCGLALSALGNHLAGGFGALRLSLLLQGLCFVGVMTAGQAGLMLATEGRRQVQALTLWATGVPIGYAAGLLMVSGFAGTPGWRGAFLLHAAVAGGLLLGSLVLLPAVGRAGGAGAAVGGVLRNVRVLRLGFALGLGSLAGLGSNAVLPLHLQQALSIAPAASAQLLALASLAGVVGSIVVGTLLAKGWPAMRVAWLVGAVAAAGALVTFLPGMAWPAVATGIVMMQLTVGGSIALCFTVLPRLLADPAQSGVAAGLVGQISGIGASLSAPLFFAALGLQNPVVLAALVIGAWTLLLMLIPTRKLAPEAP